MAINRPQETPQATADMNKVGGITFSPPAVVDVRTPPVPDHKLIRRIGKGAYGEVWQARNMVGTLRAVKVVHRRNFSEAYSFEREFKGIQKYEPVSRSHEGLIVH